MEASRVDVVATDIGRLRESIRTLGPDGVVSTLLNYRPRAEKRPPTLDKSDVLLTTSVLAGNCSNFVIDWTWSDGVGRELELDFDPQSNLQGILRGVSHRGGYRSGVGNEPAEVVEASLPQPWFGFADDSSDSGNPNLDVTFASAYLGGSFYDREVRLHAPLAYHPEQASSTAAPPSRLSSTGPAVCARGGLDHRGHRWRGAASSTSRSAPRAGLPLSRLLRAERQGAVHPRRLRSADHRRPRRVASRGRSTAPTTPRGRPRCGSPPRSTTTETRSRVVDSCSSRSRFRRGCRTFRRTEP